MLGGAAAHPSKNHEGWGTRKIKTGLSRGHPPWRVRTLRIRSGRFRRDAQARPPLDRRAGEGQAIDSRPGIETERLAPPCAAKG